MNDDEKKEILRENKEEPCRHPKLEAGKDEGEIACALCGRIVYSWKAAKIAGK
ncbi:MAG: hypothetical protein ACJ76F_13425 [Bacteroidia bacterium]